MFATRTLAAHITLLATATGTAHAAWITTNLHPAGAEHSEGASAGPGQQGGNSQYNGALHAGYWNGTSASWVDLDPPGNNSGSQLFATDGVQQVGWIPQAKGNICALWSGSAASLVDLTPAGSTSATAYAVSGGRQGGGAFVGEFEHAALWADSAASFVDLHPSGFRNSRVTGISGGQQVGYAVAPGPGGETDAGLWTGSAESWTSLAPAGSTYSVANGVHAGQQVGAVSYGASILASLWTGTAESHIVLNPAGVLGAEALGVYAGRQAGFVYLTDHTRAALWSGTADSYIDLHQFLPPEMTASRATGVWSDANFIYVVGSAYSPEQQLAFLWTGNIPAPGSAALILPGAWCTSRRRRHHPGKRIHAARSP